MDFNGTAAAKRAGYSPKTAAVQAYDLRDQVCDPKIVAENQSDRSMRGPSGLDVTLGPGVVQELASGSAFADIRTVARVDEDGLRIHPSDGFTGRCGCKEIWCRELTETRYGMRIKCCRTRLRWKSR